MKKWAYYNEFDPKAAAWLRELIKQKLIADGEVDERSITDVRPGDLRGFTQCHFFAGIGGWSLALRLAGWGDELPVWTGSCPCQPFSSAGKGLAQADHRHMWPVFARLIAECRPDVVFGEQVASAIGKGWLDGVRADMEREGYAVGAAVLGAHSVGAPHIRQRLYWVAQSESNRDVRRPGEVIGSTGGQTCRPADIIVGRSVIPGWLANIPQHGRGEGEPERGRSGEGDATQGYVGRPAVRGYIGGMADSADDGHATGDGLRAPAEPSWTAGADGEREPAGSGYIGGLAEDPTSRGCGGRRDGDSAGEGWEVQAPGLGAHGWGSYRVIPCRDGKHRRIPAEPAFFPLAHGIPERVVRLRGYGNAIVPQVAAEFIQAYGEIAQ